MSVQQLPTIIKKKLDELHQCLKHRRKCEISFRVDGYGGVDVLDNIIEQIHDSSRIPYLSVAKIEKHIDHQYLPTKSKGSDDNLFKLEIEYGIIVTKYGLSKTDDKFWFRKCD